MTKCIVCGRILKQPTSTGAGKICARKLRNLGEVSKRPVRVEIIYRQGFKRRYLVFTDPRQIVTIDEQGGEKFAGCRGVNCKGRCVHIDAAAIYDNVNFPVMTKGGLK